MKAIGRTIGLWTLAALLAAGCAPAPPQGVAPASRPPVERFTQKVDQPFAGDQSPEGARLAAIARAKQEALERAGTYLESLSVVEDARLTRDETLALAAGVLDLEVLSQKNYATENGFGILLTLRIDVDRRVLDERVRGARQDAVLMTKYQELQQREQTLLERIAALERQHRELGSASGGEALQQRRVLQRQYQEAVQGLPAVELNRRAIALWQGGRYTDPALALEFLDQAIALDPADPKAFNNRGAAYLGLGRRHEAIEDFSQALLLDARYEDALHNRAIVLAALGEHRRAVADFDRVIQHDPQRVEAYLGRAGCLKNLWQYTRALEDYRMALHIRTATGGGSAPADSAAIDAGEIAGLCAKAQAACRLGLCLALESLQRNGFCTP